MKDKLNPILFLDLDDVVCPGDPLCGYASWDVWEVMKTDRQGRPEVIRGAFHPESCEVLLAVCDALADEGLRVVLSSSWRKTFDRDQIVEILGHAGLSRVADCLEPESRWCTTLTLDGSDRAQDIAHWLYHFHAGEPFAVLDDNYSGPTLLHMIDSPLWRDRLTICEQAVGLKHEHTKGIIKALRRRAARAQSIKVFDRTPGV